MRVDEKKYLFSTHQFKKVRKHKYPNEVLINASKYIAPLRKSHYELSGLEELEENIIEQYKNHIKGYTIHYSDTINKDIIMEKCFYTFCPHCNKAHRRHEYLIPKTSFDKIIKKYEKIFAIIDFFTFEDYYPNNSNEDVMLQLIGDGTSVNKYIYNNIISSHTSQYSEDEKYLIKELEALYIPVNEFECDEEGLVQKCPSCGERIKHDKSKKNTFSIDDDEYISMKLTREKTWFYDNIIDYSYSIFKNENKVVFSLIRWRIFPNINGKFHIVPTNTRLVFNTETGMSYSFRECNMETKKPLNCNDTRIKNTTYSGMMMNAQLTENETNDILKAICETKNIDVIKVSDIAERNKLRPSYVLFRCLVNAVNRYGNLGLDFISNYCMMNINNVPINNNLKRKWFLFQSSPEVFAKYIKNNHIKSKKIISLIANNPINIFYYKNLIDSDFKSQDSYIKLLESKDYDNMSKIIKTINSYESKQFIKDYVELKSETELVNKILSNPLIYKDVCTMYTKILVSCDLKDDSKRKMFKGNLLEIHDRLTKIYNNISDTEFNIPYEKNDLKLNCICDDYYFELAKTSTDMKEVGSKMHICVGSYSRRAFSRNCIIVFMKNRKTKLPEVCIEISPDKKLVLQVKDYCNASASKEKWLALNSYFKYHNIETISCDCVFVSEETTKVTQYKSNDYKIFKKTSEATMEEMMIRDNTLEEYGIVYKKEKTPYLFDEPFW